jgi:2'-hydroxyisoflavone reductase
MDSMGHSRRDFLQSSLAAGAMVAWSGAASPAPRGAAAEPAKKKLRILFLGGTGFLGPATVQYALDRGHEVTLFNRGKTDPKLFPDLERFAGDRDPDVGDGLSAIAAEIESGRRWDAVIDTSAQFPRIARASAELVADASEHYVYISSISAYADHSVAGIDETGAVATMEDETVEDFGPSFENYGPLKALCEQAAESAMPGRVSNIRPGLIVGPRDWSDRFSYWPVRVSQGGEVLSPGTPDDPVQYIDVRDLGAFMITCCENRAAGVFNATGPNYPTTVAEMLHGCKAVTGGSARFTWVPADFLAEHAVAPWMHMPVWVPPNGESGGMMSVDCRRAIDAGLTTRPLAQTVSATLDWFFSLPEKQQARLGPDAVSRTPENMRDESIIKRRAGIGAKREAEVLAAWHEHQAAEGA